MGARCVHHKELDPVNQHKCPQQEFDLRKSQILLFFPVLKFLPVLSSRISTVVVACIPELLKLIKANHFGVVLLLEANVFTIPLTKGECKS